MNFLGVDEVIRQALAEDIGLGDITTEAIVPEDHCSTAEITAKAKGIVAGIEIAQRVFTLIDQNVRIEGRVKDGDDVVPGQVIAVIEGKTRTLLTGERVALNFIQRLSGIATETKQAVERVREFSCHIVDTRKTTPGLRGLEKYAVRVGGGYNHRLGLFDAVLIKDNHIEAAGGITEAVRRVRERARHMVKVEVEVETLDQVQEALQSPVDIIMFDNMDPKLMREAVQLVNGKVLTEASGGITLDSLVEVAKTGVDLISLGWLTHSVRALDISMNIVSVSNHGFR